MKNTFFLLLIIAAALASCSKDDDVDPIIEKYRLKEANYSSTGDYTKYEYDTQGRLIKILDNNQSIEYTYNSLGKLIRIDKNNPLVYDFYNEQYSYSVTGNVEEMIFSYREVYSNEIKNRTTYKFMGNKLIESSFYYWDKTTESWFNIYTITYEYNDEGRLVKTDYRTFYTIYSYDNNGNQIEAKEFLLKPGSSTQFYLSRSTTYTFDDKINIFNNIYPDPSNSYTNNPNNYIDVVTKNFNENGAIINVNTSTTSYEYNSAGYPIKVNYTGGNSTNYILEKY